MPDLHNSELLFTRSLEESSKTLLDIARERAAEAMMFNRWDYRSDPLVTESSDDRYHLRFVLSDDFDLSQRMEGSNIEVFLPVTEMKKHPSPSDIINGTWFIRARRMRREPTENDPSRFVQDEELLLINGQKIETLVQVGPKILCEDDWAELEAAEAQSIALDELPAVSAPGHRRGQLAVKLAFADLVPTLL